MYTNPATSAQSRGQIELGLARGDFAANALCGMPVDYWANKLGWDRTKWVEEAFVIRDQWTKEMQQRGVGSNLSKVPLARSIGAPLDGLSPELYEFYQKLNPTPWLQQNTTLGGNYAPPR